jgi:hypothetical protein
VSGSPKTSAHGTRPRPGAVAGEVGGRGLAGDHAFTRAADRP